MTRERREYGAFAEAIREARSPRACPRFAPRSWSQCVYLADHRAPPGADDNQLASIPGSVCSRPEPPTIRGMTVPNRQLVRCAILQGSGRCECSLIPEGALPCQWVVLTEFC